MVAVRLTLDLLFHLVKGMADKALFIPGKPGALNCLHIVAVALVRGDATRRGMRTDKIALFFKKRHLVADGGRAYSHLGVIGDNLGGHGRRPGDVLPDDIIKYQTAPGSYHLVSVSSLRPRLLI
jgi:hypothetical protein